MIAAASIRSLAGKENASDFAPRAVIINYLSENAF
jgi:hypothetical protein